MKTKLPLQSAIIAAAAVGFVLLYFFVDPASTRWMPQCVFLRITGLQCPGCGAQRMAYSLLHGDLHAAWGHNAFLMLMIPLLLFMSWLETRRTRNPRLYAGFHSLPVIIALGASVAVWFVLRNFVL